VHDSSFLVGISMLQPKIIKQRWFNRRWDRGEGGFSGIVLGIFCIEIILRTYELCYQTKRTA
jgi:hypothetical protein